MEISKKRIRSLAANLPAELQGQMIVVAAPKDVPLVKLSRLGLAEAPDVGSSILPAVVGPVTRYNAEGKFLIHRDQPKETVYRQAWVKWTERHGDKEVEREDVRDIPYERYPRTPIEPPSVEMVVIDLEGTPVVAAPKIEVDFENEDDLRHLINLFLEAFGSCRVLSQSLEPVTIAATTRLNWHVLPPGEMPWQRLEPELKQVLDRQSKGKRPVFAYRLEYINRYKPEFVAVGNGGFSGYVVFGFPRLGIYILECATYANATYVFEKDWGLLSQLTKAEILNASLHTARFVHQPRWADRIMRLFNRK